MVLSVVCATGPFSRYFKTYLVLSVKMSTFCMALVVQSGNVDDSDAAWTRVGVP